MDNEKYGISIASRYDLFYDQDDASTDFETVITKKKKSKEPAQQTQTPSPATGVQQKSAAEKENKQVKKATENGTGTQKATPDQQQQRRGIKEQNNSNKDINSTGPRKDGDNKGFSNNRPAFNKSASGAGENREERNNRRNREMNGTLDFEKPRTATGGSGGSGSAVGQRNQNRRPFDGRKRERDRQSGSDKTGVKPVDKRDGNGAHNWGSHKQDIDDINKPPTDDEIKESGEETGEESTPQAPVEEEPKEMTLDEWKAQRQAQLLQPQYNLRKAGEGEDNAQWDKMKRLDKKSGDGEVNRKDEAAAAAAKKEADAKKKKVLDIEFNFNDGRRGGLGRRTGPGGRGGEGGGQQNRRPRPNREQRDCPRDGPRDGHRDGPRDGHRDGPRDGHRDGPRDGHRDGPRDGPRDGHRDGPRPNREQRDSPRDGPRDAGDKSHEGNAGGEQRERRPPRRPRFENRRGDFHHDVPHAPKVDDERDFPSLG